MSGLVRRPQEEGGLILFRMRCGDAGDQWRGDKGTGARVDRLVETHGFLPAYRNFDSLNTGPREKYATPHKVAPEKRSRPEPWKLPNMNGQPLHILKAHDKVGPYVADVQRIADANRDSFGFLPAGAYADAASKSRLWIATDGSDEHTLHGYLLFGGHRRWLRVYQIYLAPHFRGQGFAKALLDELKAYGRKNHDNFITARVGADLAANKFWTTSGFSLVQQQRGGETTNRTINIYALNLTPSLVPVEDIRVKPSEVPPALDVPGPSLQVPNYAIDVNFLVDFVKERGDIEACRYVLQSALANNMRVYVTSEFAKELSRYTTSDPLDPVYSVAAGFPVLPKAPEQDLESLISTLDEVFHPTPKTGRKSTNDASDLVHLATCIFHHIHGFITRDSKILRHANYLKKTHNLEVLTATDIDDGRFRADRETGFGRVAAGGMHVAISEIRPEDREEIDDFVSRLDADLNADVWSSFDTLQSPGVVTTAMARVDDILVGLGIWKSYPESKNTVHAHLLVDENSPSTMLLIDHLVQVTTRIGDGTSLCTSYVHICPFQLGLLELARSRGFVDIEYPYIQSLMLKKVSLNQAIALNRWPAFRGYFKDVTNYTLPNELPSYGEASNTGIALRTAKSKPFVLSLFDFETTFGPGMIAFDKRGAVIVPIRRGYAESLLPEYDRQTQLLPGKEATLRLERAYFMSPNRPVKLERGGVIVFYVSGRSGGPKRAFALARVTFASVLSISQARMMTLRQGVLNDSDLKARAVKGQVAMFTFDNLLALKKPVPYAVLKNLGCVGGANLVTAQHLSPLQLRSIVDYSYEDTV